MVGTARRAVREWFLPERSPRRGDPTFSGPPSLTHYGKFTMRTGVCIINCQAFISNTMKTSATYVPSKLLAGEIEVFRQHSFTRWLSRDLMQAAVDFCRNLGLVPAYCECSPDHLTRYLFWRLPQGAAIEVRSGRSKEKFEEHDRANQARNLRLLSLHINESDIYSAVWISADYFEIAKAILVAHGITCAERKRCVRDACLRTPKSSPKATNFMARGAHAPRVWWSAPPPTTSLHLLYFLWNERKQSARAPTATRGGACAPPRP